MGVHSRLQGCYQVLFGIGYQQAYSTSIEAVAYEAVARLTAFLPFLQEYIMAYDSGSFLK